MRLDIKISKDFNISRNKSYEIIKKGEVFVDEICIKKPSFQIENENILHLKLPLHVSRAGEKLDNFLENYKIDIKDKNCLDIGSSTGGFAQVLLKKNAKNITCVDVGTDQLHISLRNNKKIKLYEKTDIRDFTCKNKFDIVTCDVSFISLKSIINQIDFFSNDDIIILFKPQFEVGKNIKRNKKGVVLDENAINLAKEVFEKEAFEKKWKLMFSQKSTLTGKEGNLENFYAFKKR